MSNYLICELYKNTPINEEFFILQFVWEHEIPKAGQFFMLKPQRGTVFLPRPISIFEYNHDSKIVKFLISKRGKGTLELSQLNAGEKVQMAGPHGNAWSDFLPESGKVLLVGGSAGVAPLAALTAEKQGYEFHLYAGFRQGFNEKEEENIMLGAAVNSKKIVISAEDGRNALIGRITDFLYEPEAYDVVFGCGPMPMLHALRKKCEQKKVPCFISLESRFACGVGACLGCTIYTDNGNKRCCKEGQFSPRER
ncbi:MAG: dihydroorotate dehydrogenase electron transfer subunit [Treponema sp.]|nr:dihydroorotate dehydrogenase electron transfer subunit [Treponema sp.]